MCIKEPAFPGSTGDRRTYSDDYISGRKEEVRGENCAKGPVLGKHLI